MSGLFGQSYAVHSCIAGSGDSVLESDVELHILGFSRGFGDVWSGPVMLSCRVMSAQGWGLPLCAMSSGPVLRCWWMSGGPFLVWKMLMQLFLFNIINFSWTISGITGCYTTPKQNKPTPILHCCQRYFLQILHLFFSDYIFEVYGQIF